MSTARFVPSRVSDLTADQTDATISVGAGGSSGDLIIKTNGAERGRFTFATGSGGDLQVGALLSGGLNSSSSGTRLMASTPYVYNGGYTGPVSGFQAQATILGTSPSGPTIRFQGFTSYVQDAATVVNKTITGMSRSGTTVTVTTSAAHGLSAGDSIAIYGVTHTFNAEINGQFVIVSTPLTTTFTVTLAGLSSGSYTSGGTVTNRGAIYGYFFRVNPAVARGGLTGTAAHGDDIGAFVTYNSAVSGSSAVAAGDNIYVAHNASVTDGTSEWFTGLSVAANVDYGVVLSGTVNKYGVDLNTTYGAGAVPLRLPNAGFIWARKADNSTDVQLLGLNSSNFLALGGTNVVAISFNADLTLLGHNLILDTSTGTKIGTSTSHKLSFWNKATIVQPTTSIVGATRVGGGGTTVTTTDTYGGYTLAQLAAILINTGLAA